MTQAANGDSDDQASFAGTDWSLFVSVALIWGASFLLIDLGLEGLTPGLVTLTRVGSGAATLLVMRILGRRWMPADKGGSGRRGIASEDRARVALLAVVWVTIPFTLFPLAQESINSALTGLLNGATPIFVTVVAVLSTGRRPDRALLVGLGLGFVGVVLLSLPSLDEGSSEIRGVLMVLSATICYGFAINLAGPLQRRYGAVTLMTPILGLATVLLIPLGLRDWSDNSFELAAVTSVLVLGVVGTGLAYWIMATLVGRVGAIRASFITYLIPPVSLALGVVFRGDRVAALAIVGACFTTLGALLASGRIRLRSRDGKRHKTLV